MISSTPVSLLDFVFCFTPSRIRCELAVNVNDVSIVIFCLFSCRSLACAPVLTKEQGRIVRVARGIK